MDLTVIKDSIAAPNLEAKGNRVGNNTSNKTSKADDQQTSHKLGMLFSSIQQLCLTIIR